MIIIKKKKDVGIHLFKQNEMKILKTGSVLSILIIVILLNLVWANKYQGPTGPHGGKIKKVENFNIEKIQSHENLYTFLLDANYKPISNKGVTGEIRFYYLDETTSDIPLLPYETEGFTVKMPDNSYYSCRITFTISGKSISAKFDNESLIVSKQNKNLQK